MATLILTLGILSPSEAHDSENLDSDHNPNDPPAVNNMTWYQECQSVYASKASQTCPDGAESFPSSPATPASVGVTIG